MPAVGERLVVIVDRAGAEAVERILAAAPAGAVLVQVRDKALGGRDLHALAARLREVTRRAGARLVVNDRVDVALAVGADGVHLPEAGLPVAEARALLGPEALVGASRHGAEGAAAAAAAGADLVTVGPVWETPGKGPPIGPAELAEAARRVAGRAALFALGGVDGPARAREAARAGAHGVAVIRAAAQAAALVAALVAAPGEITEAGRA